MMTATGTFNGSAAVDVQSHVGGSENGR